MPDHVFAVAPTWAQWRAMAKEFFDAAKTANMREAQAGLKTLALAYFAMGGTLTKQEEHEAVIVLKIAGQKVMEKDIIVKSAREAIQDLRAFARG